MSEFKQINSLFAIQTIIALIVVLAFFYFVIFLVAGVKEEVKETTDACDAIVGKQIQISDQRFEVIDCHWLTGHVLLDNGMEISLKYAQKLRVDAE